MTDESTRSDEPEPTHADATRHDVPPQPSILAQLEDDGRAAPYVRLRVAGEPATALPDVPMRAARDRYEIVGEIARGGVGIVYKGRDRDIGRDVAMKVVRDEHAERADVLERFVEEAQIGGQLQHPGIVPIYELGLQADQRPYFTMKLIKGETFASLLAKRDVEPGAERRFLRAFESVCQTMAYAHSRGVIHRDLKPSNIMVGHFGEVQVVDWGFAKVLAAGGVADERRARQRAAEDTLVATVRSESEGSDSIDGTILGTPAYMPPEQALGQVEDLDERADVFSLGGILCEILTGKPPYVTDETTAVSKAVRSDLEDALRRLEASPADPELKTLARSCMAPMRTDRPQDANVLAQRIGSYLASVEERAHRSAVEQAEAEAEAARTEREAAEARARAQKARHSAKEAQARAEQQGRARRQTRAIGLAMAALLVVGIGAWVWVRTENRAVRRAAEEQVESALAEATYYEGLEQWDAAVAAARKALELAGSGDAPQEVLVEARTTHERLARLQRVVQSQALRDDRDRELVARLEAVRALSLDGASLREWDRRYALAFAEHGLDVAELSGEALGHKIAESLERKTVAGFLDEWALLRRDGLQADPEAWRPLLVAAEVADGPGWRNQLRRTLGNRDRRALETLANEAERIGKDASTLGLLGKALAAEGASERAVSFLARAQHAHPDDVWLNVHLAQQLARSEPPNWSEAVRYYSVARALRPQSAPIRVALAHGLARIGQHGLAAHELRAAVQMQPGLAYAHHQLGLLVLAQEGADAALPYVRQALANDPDLPQAHAALAEVLRRMGRHKEARSAARKAIELDQELVEGHENLFLVLADEEDLEGALAAIERAARLAEVQRVDRAPSGAKRPAGGHRPGVRRILSRFGADKRNTSAARVAAHGLEREGAWAQALAAWRQILLARPDDPVALKRLATLLALVPDPALRDPKQADTLALKLLAKAPDHAAAHTVHGVVLLEAGDTPAAMQAFQKVLGAGKGAAFYRPFAHYGLARAHAAEGATEKALAHYDAGMKLLHGKTPADPLLRVLWVSARTTVEPLRKEEDAGK